MIWQVSRVMNRSRVGQDCRIGQNIVVRPRAHIGGVQFQNNPLGYDGVTLEDPEPCGPTTRPYAHASTGPASL